MTPTTKLIPTGSQTVGPYFRIGLEDLIHRAPQETSSEAVTIHGRVLDRDGAPVPDAMLEFWSATEAVRNAASDAGHHAGFRRAATDDQGNFSVTLRRPVALPFGDGTMQSPHLLVLVFTRGLLRHLITRVYFADEAGNGTDAVLHAVPAERRGTLTAQPDAHAAHAYHWNVVLQGQDETVFFAW